MGIQPTRTLSPIVSQTLAFAPWIVFAAGGSAASIESAMIAALFVALMLNLHRWQRGGWAALKVLELAALSFFSVALLSGYRGPWLAPAGNALLALCAWVSLALGQPFTLQYARATTSAAQRTDSLFLDINRRLTAFWGLLFTFAAGIAAVVVLWRDLPLGLSRGWLVGVLMAGGAAASAAYPRRRAARVLAQRLARMRPYPQPAPRFAVGYKDERSFDVIVVGAGIGGLTAAALLARRGLRVAVFERHYVAGGYCSSYVRNIRHAGGIRRFVFDAGVHDVSGLAPGHPTHTLLATLGLQRALRFVRTDHAYRMAGVDLSIPTGGDALLPALLARFPHEAAGLQALFRVLRAVYSDLFRDAAHQAAAPRLPLSVAEMMEYPARCPHAYRWSAVPFLALLDAHVCDARLRRLLCALTGYLSADPASLTVGAMAPIFGYYFDGGGYPLGSSQALPDALVASVRAHRGEVHLRTPVAKILLEGGRCAGIRTQPGAEYRAPVVIAAGDVRHAMVDLLHGEPVPAEYRRRVESLQPTTSAVSVALGVVGPPLEASLNFIEDDEGRFGVASLSRLDPSLAPTGYATVTLTRLIPQAEAAQWQRNASYGARKKAEGEALLARAERVFPGLSQRIVFRQVATPRSFERFTHATGGAIYGLAGGDERLTAETPVPGLYLAGACAFPGTGVEGAIISGFGASNLICPGDEDRQKNSLTPVASECTV